MFYYIFTFKGEKNMLKILAKIAEKYAKSTNTACWLLGIVHQPKNASIFNKEGLENSSISTY